MQDKIPDALIDAFERHYAFPWDEPTLRNERLAWRAAWAEATKPCLLQIQEPSSAEQAAWHAGLDEGRAQAAQHAAVDVPAYEAAALSEYLKDCELKSIVPDVGGAFSFAFAAGVNLATSQASAEGDYLEGVSIPNLREALIFLGRENGAGEGEVGDKLARYVNSVVSGVLSKKATLRETPQAAPAAVAVPDAVRDAEKLLRAEAARLDRLYGMNKWYGFCAEKASHLEHLRVAAALAATPAAAAQVVLPEPQHWVLETQALDREFDYTGVEKKAEHWKAIGLNPTALFTEQQLRAALLAGVSAPAAQAVEHAPVLYVSKGQLDNFRDPDGPDSTAHGRYLPARVTPSGKFTTPLFAAPQAQADARDAEITWPKARDVGRIGDMSPSAHIRVGFDSDNDVYVSVWDERGGGSIEFCNPGGGGGGQSSRTRLALIALMVAMEADNTEKPSLDWWAQRAAQAAQQGGDKQ